MASKCPVCNSVIDSENLFPNFALQSLQNDIELKKRNEKYKKKTSVHPIVNDEIIKEFFKMIEEKKTETLEVTRKQLENIKNLKEKSKINFRTSVIGSKRKATEIHDDKVEEKLMKLKDNFTSLSETFSDKTNWECLSKNLSSFTKLYNVKEITSFRTHDSLSVTSQIISSIESDRFGSHFATAGILKQISLFNLDKMIEKPTFHDYPDLSIKCNSKISCLSWNSFNESELCSADYDGVVNLYDTVSGKLMISWTEHEKRCWSVDTSAVDPHKIISGSDDCKIKLWSKQSSKSLLTLDIRANVCTVRFSPKDSNLIAVGGADHRVFLFDLRKPSVPIFNEKKHSKSVSYVRFNNSGSSIISASTDSTLKLWSCCQDQNTWQLDKTFRGHLNEKNFVGLALLDGGLAATGSEDNCVVIYDQNLEYPVLKYSMKTTCPLTGIQMDDEMGTFVSSLSWANRPDKEGNPILLSANSTGNVSISSIIEE